MRRFLLCAAEERERSVEEKRLASIFKRFIDGFQTKLRNLRSAFLVVFTFAVFLSRVRMDLSRGYFLVVALA